MEVGLSTKTMLTVATFAVFLTLTSCTSPNVVQVTTKIIEKTGEKEIEKQVIAGAGEVEALQERLRGNNQMETRNHIRQKREFILRNYSIPCVYEFNCDRERPCPGVYMCTCSICGKNCEYLPGRNLSLFRIHPFRGGLRVCSHDEPPDFAYFSSREVRDSAYPEFRG